MKVEKPTTISYPRIPNVWDENPPEPSHWEAWREECEQQYSRSLFRAQEILDDLNSLDEEGSNEFESQGLMIRLDTIIEHLEDARRWYEEAGKDDDDFNREIEEERAHAFGY